MTLLDGLISCNKSAIVLDNDGEMDEYEAQVKILRQNLHIVKSKERLFMQSLGWVVSFGMDANLVSRFQSILQAGLITVWKEHAQFLRIIKFRRVNHLGSQMGREVKALQLGGNFMVVFCLYAVLVSFSCVSIVAEVLFGRCTKT